MVWKLIEIGLFVIRFESHAYLNIPTLLFTLAGVDWFLVQDRTFNFLHI